MLGANRPLREVESLLRRLAERQLPVYRTGVPATHAGPDARRAKGNGVHYPSEHISSDRFHLKPTGGKENSNLSLPPAIPWKCKKAPRLCFLLERTFLHFHVSWWEGTGVVCFLMFFSHFVLRCSFSFFFVCFSCLSAQKQKEAGEWIDLKPRTTNSIQEGRLWVKTNGTIFG